LGAANYFVANAGIGDVSRPKTDDWERSKKLFNVNVMAACDGLEFMKAKMVARGTGTLSGVSSVAGTRGLPDSGAYCASKAALTTYLESMRVDLKRYGVRVCTIALGFIKTGLTAKNKGTMPFVMDAGPAGEIFVRKLIAGKKWIVAPWQYAWVIRLLRYMPIWFYDLVLAIAMGSIRGSRPENRA
jgi:short-subunit dehydrogenase